jgi:hypothetical protein
MMDGRVTVEEKALSKIVLHSLKHSLGTCNGLILGEVTKESIVVKDVVPICHGMSTSLTIQMELGLALVQELLQAKEGKDVSSHKTKLVGFYQCNERMDDIELGVVEKKIADKVSSLGEAGAVLVLNGEGLGQCIEGSNGNPLVLYQKSSNHGWVKSGALTIPCLDDKPSWVARIKEYVSQGQHAAVADLDDHMEDISKDWFSNSHLAL